MTDLPGASSMLNMVCIVFIFNERFKKHAPMFSFLPPPHHLEHFDMVQCKLEMGTTKVPL